MQKRLIALVSAVLAASSLEPTDSPGRLGLVGSQVTTM
jgi:hypothetical protein